ncbi:HU family DNA-binding protein [Wenyingzhuangia aestuarii]|uniref:HU family DNA-binding protein n=1 Tax=Wenyingzhuangia aestuarii TaxID=1647582 RepID=UPI00143C9C4F|nr:HU family DNA-binding protein [Wenyingzhuangia aestuarii]NJB82790.1 putative histone-like DNA-binding protein [Wenyingzhuangia aestuarii]
MVKIIPIRKSNPQDRTAEKKYYVQAVATGTVNLERLAYLTSHQSTVREADCYAVMLSLVHNIIDALEDGKIVKLDKLGALQVAVRSEGVVDEKDLSNSLVKKAHLNFRPDSRLRDMLNNLKYQLLLKE